MLVRCSLQCVLSREAPRSASAGSASFNQWHQQHRQDPVTPHSVNKRAGGASKGWPLWQWVRSLSQAPACKCPRASPAPPRSSKSSTAGLRQSPPSVENVPMTLSAGKTVIHLSTHLFSQCIIYGVPTTCPALRQVLGLKQKQVECPPVAHIRTITDERGQANDRRLR